MSGTDPIKSNDLVDKHSTTPLDDNTVPTTLSHVPSTTPANTVDIVLQDQSIRLPLSRLLMIYFGIGLALVLSFMDQTSVSTAAPVIGTDIGGSERYGGTLEVSTLSGTDIRTSLAVLHGSERRSWSPSESNEYDLLPD